MISVLGAGSAGLGMVVHLSSMGVPIRLWNRSCSKLKIFESGSPAVSVGVIKGEFPVNQVTCDIRDVVDSDVIICDPSHGHGEILDPQQLCYGVATNNSLFRPGAWWEDCKRILGELIQIISVRLSCTHVGVGRRGHIELLAIKPLLELLLM